MLRLETYFGFGSEPISFRFGIDFGLVQNRFRFGFGFGSERIWVYFGSDRVGSIQFGSVRRGLGTVRFGSESFLVQNRSRFASEPTSVRSRFRFAPEPIFVGFGLFRFGSVWRRIRYKR